MWGAIVKILIIKKSIDSVTLYIIIIIIREYDTKG